MAKWLGPACVQKPWVWWPAYSWVDFPFQHVSDAVYWYYMLQLGFYINSAITIFTDVKRSVLAAVRVSLLTATPRLAFSLSPAPLLFLCFFLLLLRLQLHGHCAQSNERLGALERFSYSYANAFSSVSLSVSVSVFPVACLRRRRRSPLLLRARPAAGHWKPTHRSAPRPLPVVHAALRCDRTHLRSNAQAAALCIYL